MVNSAFEVAVEPRNHSVEYIELIRVAPLPFPMTFVSIAQISDRLAEATQAGEDFVRKERRHCTVTLAVHDQQRRCDSIEVKDRRVLDIPLAKLPGAAAHSPLAAFGPGYAGIGAIGQQVTVAAFSTWALAALCKCSLATAFFTPIFILAT